LRVSSSHVAPDGLVLMDAWRVGPESDVAVIAASIGALLAETGAEASRIEDETCLILGAACKALGWTAESDAAFARACRTEGMAPLAAQFAALPMDIADAWRALGIVLRSLERLDGARAAFEQALAAGTAQPDIHKALATTLMALGQTEAAQARLERMLELRIEDAEVLAYLSLLHQQQARLAEAAAFAHRALEADPDLRLAHRSLSAIYDAMGDAASAKRHRDQAFAGDNLVITPAARARSRVLILTTTGSGNTPDRNLIPVGQYTRLLWFIEYATEDQMTNLPPFDVVFNGIGDPDLAAPTAEAVNRFVDQCARRVLNDPRRVAMTARDQTRALLAGLQDVVTPQTVRLSPAADDGLSKAVLDGFDGPVLLRPIGSHGGEGLQLLDGAGALPDLGGADHYLTAFHDFRSADGLYRKYRMFFVDRRPYPYHLAISAHWMVHRQSSGMDEWPERIAEEARFLEDPEGAIGSKALRAVTAIGERIGLDFCGLDFSVLADGQVLVFEANAAMLVHPEAPDGPLAHKNPHIARIIAAFQQRLTPSNQGAP
jgi:tetratricopeptide (TPR) repeat protein